MTDRRPNANLLHRPHQTQPTHQQTSLSLPSQEACTSRGGQAKAISQQSQSATPSCSVTLHRQQQQRTRSNAAARSTCTFTTTMRILVGVKRVIDYAVKVRVAADKKGTCLRGQMGRGLGRGLQTPRRRCPKAPLNCQAASSTVTTGQPQVRLFPVSFAKYAPHSLFLPFLLLPPPPH